MLLEFEFSNFLSFKEKQKLDLKAQKSRVKNQRVYKYGKNKYLKFASIFGSNGSGKSNLVYALDFMKERLLNEESKTKYNYFKLDERFRNKESLFNVEILVDEEIYEYGYEIYLATNQIKSEWLYIINKKGDKKAIFNRSLDKNEIKFSEKYFKNEKIIERLNVYGEDIKDDDKILFLSIMNQNKTHLYKNNEKSEIILFKKIFDWFQTKLIINFPEYSFNSLSYFMEADSSQELIELLRWFDFGIDSYKFIDVSKDEIIENIPKQFLNKIEREFEIRNKTKQNFSKLGLLRGRKSHKNSYYIIGYNEGEVIYKTIKFIHQGNNALFGVSEESDGTLKMLDLFDILLDKDNDRVYVVDELDLFLHPSISYKFISKFLELAQNKNIQLIVTSHETKLLDFNLLRRDEVWFTIKQSDGESNLVNLSKFAPRSDKKLEKAYFDGDFDIIPEQNLHHSNH
ncbi:ATP/GTP-binding protein [uncultured Dubosiella sp.]|uniref:AAA family ATPase n=3 Tax=uncultured Dubosiella sp. TaxID=1937011 RepID=UPI0025945235|nr:AAA family ATPase [uncultured Dubosiella sp.]